VIQNSTKCFLVFFVELKPLEKSAR